MKEVARLIRGLFTISLQGDALGQTAHNALMLVGAQDPKQFIVCIGSEIHKDTAHAHTHAARIHLSVKFHPARTVFDDG